MLRHIAPLFAITATVSMTAMAPAHAAPTTLLGVYEEVATATCKNQSSCIVVFTQLSKPLKITNVSCSVPLVDQSKGIGIQNFALGDMVYNSAGAKWVAATFMGPIGLSAYLTPGYPYLNASYSVLHVSATLWKPAVLVLFNAATNITISCSIAGAQ